ncbi:MAG: fibronectin type III domain-containing protein [Bacteroidales bacterium]|nr:fibronectin type III domain-containing protein [Bacteroidales bacterium]
MKHYSFLFIAWCLLFSTTMKAQTPDSTIAIPNPSFEQWSTGSGYSVTVLIFPLTVYSSYTYPTGWNYPTYPVNESITYSGMNVNVNTNLPLLKVSNETSGVPHGSHALKLQSFMLSDIISSTVYNLASSELDPALTTTVFPTVLSTGVVDIDQLMPLMYDITGNLGSLTQMLTAFSGTDINTIIDGGIALNGAVPDRLTGYYKYTSAVSGDNGGILMIGSKYNTTTHKREVVGGGYTTAMTDTNAYTPFEITYSPLSEVNPSYPYIEADSLIIFLFSSANTSPQQGSALYLDGLQLWAQQPAIPADTCSAIFNLAVNSVDTMHATIGWTYEGTPDHFEAEYGIQGFTQGNGTSANAASNSLSLSSLQPDTYYDVYVRSVCSSTLTGEWSMVSFHTDTLVPPAIPEPDTCSAVFNLHVIDVDTMSATIGWSFEGDVLDFEAEYGIQGFTQGNGTTIHPSESFLHLSNLQPDTYYDLYVRCGCGNDLWGEWAKITFHTDTLVPPVIPDDSTGIQSFNTDKMLVYPNPAQGRCTVQFKHETPSVARLFTMEGVLVKELTPTGESFELTLPGSGIFLLVCELREGTVIQRIISQ